MALFKIFKGQSSGLPKTYKDGYCYFTTDDGKMYIDTKDSDSTGRICLNAKHADTATKATQDSNGNIISSTYLKLSGGTMTGNLTMSNSKITTNSTISQDYTINSPIEQPVSINASLASGVELTDKNAQGIGFHVGNTTWGNLILAKDGFKFINNSRDALMPLHVSRLYGNVTGNLTGNADTATKLKITRTIQTNLASITSASFDGSTNITPGVTGTLPISNGGTGASNRATAITNLGVFGLYSRSDIGTAPNFDNPGVNGLFELRSTTETSGETGTKPFDGFAPFISLRYSNTMFQLTGVNAAGFYIRGKQAGDPTLTGVPWQKILTSNNWSDYAAAKSHTHNNYVPLSGGTMTGSLTTTGLSISHKPSQYVALSMHGSGRFYFQMIPDSNSVRNHLRYVDSTTGKYIDYYLGNDATSLSETKGYRILTAENYSSYALPLSGGTITGQLNVQGAFVAENTSYMYGSMISVGAGLYDRYNNYNYEMIVSYKNGNTVLGASGGGLYIGYQNTNYLNIGNLGNWAYWDASVLRLNQEIQSTNVHPLRSVYGDYGMIFRNDGSNFWFLPTAAGDQYGSWAKTYTRINLASGQIYGAVWNDYAEFRQYTDSEEIPYGRVVCENGDGSLSISTERLQLGANICSDTFGQAIGEKDDVKMPIAVAGRVLAYPYEDRDSYIPGEPVCAGPNGTVSKMTREEIKEYPECIIGTVSEVPQYEEWNEIKVNGRIWIKVR